MPIFYRQIYWILFVLLFASACNGAGNSLTPLPDGLIDTLAVQTWSAMQTQQALLATPTPPHLQPTFTPVPPATLRPTRTPTPLDPAAIAACNTLLFVEDVAPPPDAIFPPGVKFTKTWRVRNTGTCTWDATYALVPVTGDAISGETAPLSEIVPPGRTIDLSVQLTVPLEAGSYQAGWMLRSGKTLFGSGTDGKVTLPVKITVTQPQEDVFYNFAENYCQAYWETASGRLPCPGKANRSTGFVLLLNDPKLEGRHENEATLWVHPEMISDGWISGTYPPLGIQAGDHFKAETGCLKGYPLCYITFQIAMIDPEGQKEIIKEWDEFYDGTSTLVDIDLSPLAGKTVSFILTVIGSGTPEQNAAFWFLPQIQQQTPKP